MSHKKRTFWPLILLVVGLVGLLTACGSTTAPSAPITNSSPQVSTHPAQTPLERTQTGGQSNTDKTTTPVGSGTAASNQLILPNPPSRTFSYANLQFSITKGVISNPPGNTSATARLKLDLSINNPTKESIRISAGLFQLKLGNGTLLKQPLDLTVEARDTQNYALDFEVPPSTRWEGMQLQLDENKKEPVVIALDGPVTNSVYLVSLPAGMEVPVEKAKASYTLTKASLALDAQGERVEKGKRFLLMSVLVTNRDAKNELYVDDGNFRLIVDGKPQSPEKIDPVAEGVKVLGKQEFELAFSIPQTATSVILEVGQAGKATASILLDLNPTKNPALNGSPSPASAGSVSSPTPTRTAASAGEVGVSPAVGAVATPAKVTPGGSGSVNVTDPCKLFSPQDFVAVFNKAANEPDRDDFPEWSSCSYEFAESAETSTTVYGLEIRLLKGDFAREKFESTYQALQPRLQKVEGLGEIAYLLPAANPDNVTSLFVLKGKTSFTLSLLEPASIKEGQRQNELKAAAEKIVQRL